MKHIEFTKLIERHERQLDQHEESEIANHIAACITCRAEESKLAAFVSYSAIRATEDVPQAVSARLLNIYDRRPLPDVSGAPKVLGAGFLIFDDWATALNERYSGMDSRQMVFRVGEFEIDLRIEFIGDNCRLTGQIFPSIQDGVIEVESTDVFRSELDESGSFDIGTVPRGSYDVRISVGGDILLIEKLPLER